MKFRVVETVWYEVEAETCEAASKLIEEPAGCDKFPAEVEDRYVVPLDSDGNATGMDCVCPQCIADMQMQDAHAAPGAFCPTCGESHCVNMAGHMWDDNGFCVLCGGDGNA